MGMTIEQARRNTATIRRLRAALKSAREQSFVGVPTRVLEKELERRGSLAYARNVNRELRAREAHVIRSSRALPNGVPCDHPGCLSHISHPCEGCGRRGGISE